MFGKTPRFDARRRRNANVRYLPTGAAVQSRPRFLPKRGPEMGSPSAADRRCLITEANVRSAIDLCRRLDGIALAIEKAAREVLRAEGAAMSDAEVGAWSKTA